MNWELPRGSEPGTDLPSWRLRRVLPIDNFSQQMIISLFPMASCLPELTDTIRVCIVEKKTHLRPFNLTNAIIATSHWPVGPSIAIQWMPACFLLGEQCGDGLWGHQQGATQPASPRTLSWWVGRGPQEFLFRGEMGCYCSWASAADPVGCAGRNAYSSLEARDFCGPVCVESILVSAGPTRARVADGSALLLAQCRCFTDSPLGSHRDPCVLYLQSENVKSYM